MKLRHNAALVLAGWDFMTRRQLMPVVAERSPINAVKQQYRSAQLSVALTKLRNVKRPKPRGMNQGKD